MKLVTYNTKIDRILNITVRQLESKGITLLLSTKNYVDCENCKSNGFFSDNKKVMAVALGLEQDKWVKIFLHESCHFDQWVENCKVWRASTEAGRGGHGIFNWIENNYDYTTSKVLDYANVSKNVELDCERRVIDKIKKFDLPYNVKQYAQSAGAYIMFYNYMAETRKWYKIGKEPYYNLRIIKEMPTNLNGKYLPEDMTNKLRKLFAECV